PRWRAVRQRGACGRSRSGGAGPCGSVSALRENSPHEPICYDGRGHRSAHGAYRSVRSPGAMRTLLLAPLCLPLPALAQAQGLFDADGEPLPWPERPRCAPPVRPAPARSGTEAGGPLLVVDAEGAGGRRETVVAPAARAPVRVVHADGWVQLSQGCAPACSLPHSVDRQGGRVAGPLA